ncbi:Uncharacterised protein [Klebsiella michiganensis]|uniref:Uncharacterized protein n=1 Tax=Klebsiella michiganensis TaxID=1134687 RepID=A0A7H4MW68_9ENTR|nr:Uncharacterised protein [Klebsiella michiganensis]
MISALTLSNPKKGKLAGEVETLNGKLTELDQLKSALEDEIKQLKRPAGGTQSKAATEHKTAFIDFMRKGKDDGLRDLSVKPCRLAWMKMAAMPSRKSWIAPFSIF